MDNSAAFNHAAETVAHLAGRFDTIIQRNAVEGLTSAHIELPVHFPFLNFPTIDMQLIVYSDLVKLYSDPLAAGGKGFKTVRLFMDDPNRPLLFVEWQNGLSKRERDSRREIIRRASLKLPS